MIRYFWIVIGILVLNVYGMERIDVAQSYAYVVKKGGYLEDPEKKLDPSAVAQLPVRDFSSIEGEAAGFIFSSSAYWFRIDLKNPGTETVTRLLDFRPTWLDHIDLWIADASGKIHGHQRGGDAYPYSEREIEHFQSIFRLEIPAGDTTLLVRVETRDPFIVAMGLWEETVFYREDSRLYSYTGLFYGVLLGLIAYNLFLFYSLRRRFYGFYVLYIAAFLAMNFTYSGYSAYFFWPDSPVWGNWAHGVFIYLFNLFGLAFALVFLNTKVLLPKFYRWVAGFMGLIVLVAVVTALTGGYADFVRASIIFVVLFSLVSFSLGIVSWFFGNRTAVFFILATTAGLVGSATTAFAVSGVIPFQFVTYHAAEMGMVLDAILLALALADRYKELERERDTLNFRRMEQAVILEQKERFAKELEGRIDEALELNRHQEAVMIKQYQQASLGNLIGVIAHQLKQPLTAIGLTVQEGADRYREGELDAVGMQEMEQGVMESVRFMSNTVDDFRNFFRPDKQKKHFVLDTTLEKTFALLGRAIQKSKVDIRITGEKGCELESYESELQQVFLNLISNAVDIFAERGVAQPFIHIDISCEKERVRIRIEDNGGGIPEKALPHMFELYYTTKGDEGTGIGLHMSQMIVRDSLGGDIGVTNGENGARFEITVPKEK